MQRFLAITFGILAIFLTLLSALEARKVYSTFRNPIVLEDYFGDFGSEPDLTFQNHETITNMTDGTLGISSDEATVNLSIGSSATSAILVLYDYGGSPHFLWVATDDTVRISDTAPTTPLTDGIAIGSQS